MFRPLSLDGGGIEGVFASSLLAIPGGDGGCAEAANARVGVAGSQIFNVNPAPIYPSRG